MPSTRSYKARCIVLRKTKLGEKDLIATLLAEDGSIIRAVAKGARKPGGSLAGRIELFSMADIMFAKGRNLDVIADAKRSGGSLCAPLGLEQSACDSVIAELVATVAQEGLENPRLFLMTQAAFEEIAQSDEQSAFAVLAADLLKTLADAGFAPTFAKCSQCLEPVDLSRGGNLAFSFEDGGVVCDDCRRPIDAIMVDANTLSWAHALLFSRFCEVSAFDIPEGVILDVLHLTRAWTRAHLSKDLKSLEFVFHMGLG